MTFAWFQSDGTLPVSNDLVNNNVRMSVHISIFSFSTLPAMVSHLSLDDVSWRVCPTSRHVSNGEQESGVTFNHVGYVQP